MKILVFSDSHSYRNLMKLFMENVKPDAVIHLGDYVDDGEEISRKYPDLPFYQVPGNCDAYRCSPFMKLELTKKIGGVKMLLTHGHTYHVKSGPEYLLAEAECQQVDAVLYGHTHQPVCYQAEEGFWVLNPGTCGYFEGTAGYMVVENEKIVSCRIIRWEDTEVLK